MKNLNALSIILFTVFLVQARGAKLAGRPIALKPMHSVNVN